MATCEPRRRRGPLTYEVIKKVFNFDIKYMIDHLKLRNPIYYKTSFYGHFGKDEDFPWEKLDKLQNIKKIKNNYR